MKKLQIESLTLKGFKSIRSLVNFRPRAVNVFIGQNGAGKSNFISFFKFLSNMLSGLGNMATYVGLQGGASALLFDGPEVTQQIGAEIALRTPTGLNEYRFWLAHASSDSFIYAEEQFRYTATGRPETQQWYDLGSGHKEAALIHAEATGLTQGTIRKLLQQLNSYQFHNTTFNAPIRNFKSDLSNNWFLEEDGRNLSAVLLDLREKEGAVYQKIVSLVQLIVPFFDDFILENEWGKTYLRWRERGSSVTFVATQASDGMLRAMALVTLLCLPAKRLPAVLFLDEPELGLHPSAVKIICELIHGVSEHCQVFIATQDADMLDQFSPEEIVVVNRMGRESGFEQLQEQDLKAWEADYSLSDLWHQNVLGGKP